MSSTEIETVSHTVTCPLALVMTSGGMRVADLVVGEKATYRKYVTHLTTSTTLQGSPDSSTKTTVFNIGGKAVRNFMVHDAHAVRISCAFTPVSTLAAEISSVASKSGNYQASFMKMDLAAIVERLARGVAYFCQTGVLTPALLRGGNVYNVQAVGYMNAPTATTGSQVFIPCNIGGTAMPGAFCALVCAVNGEGSGVATDRLPINMATGEAMINETANTELALSCWHGIRILGGNMAASNQLGMWAYALMRGVCGGTTLVAHSDEGGWIRNLWARDSFASPYGALSQNYTACPSLPVPGSATRDALVTCVDVIVLACGGLVAVSDPGIDLNGRHYPTIVAVPQAELDVYNQQLALVKEASRLYTEARARIANGTAVAGDDLVPAPPPVPQLSGFSNRRGISDSFPDFASNYVRNVGILFAVPAVDTSADLARTHLIGVFNRWNGDHDAHMAHPVIAPYFHIEPTGVVPDLYRDSVAVKHSLGPLAYAYRSIVLPALPQCVVVGSSGVASNFVCAGGTARQIPLFHHLHHHQLDGLANITMNRCSPDDCVMFGGDPDIGIEARMVTRSPIHGDFWGRGHSQVISPSERTIVTSGYVGYIIVHGRVDDNYDYIPTHTHTRQELASATVTFSSTGVAFSTTGALHTPINRAVFRKRTQANNALLAQYRIHNSGGFVIAQGIMPVQLRPFNRTDISDAFEMYPATEGDTLSGEHTATSTRLDSTHMTTTLGMTPVAEAHGHQDAHRGPKAPQQVRGQLQGGIGAPLVRIAEQGVINGGLVGNAGGVGGEAGNAPPLPHAGGLDQGAGGNTAHTAVVGRVGGLGTGTGGAGGSQGTMDANMTDPGTAGDQ